MIRIAKADGVSERELINQLKARSGEIDRKVTSAVTDILNNVKQNGDDAVREYTLKFDGHMPSKFEISREEIDSSPDKCDRDFILALYKAADNIRDFHARQKQQSWLEPKQNGVILGQRIRGLKRVGVYVPGGTAAYPSSVLMNVIPAKIAGVKEIVMVTPPQKDGTANPDILAAAKIAGVDRVFLMGGAQAVAALAYGTQSVPKVDKIVGPGNIFVATAKKLLYGTIDIDMIAGPSEILVIADKTAKPEFLAADLMSQAEHDKLASPMLLTTSQALAEAVDQEIIRQMSYLERPLRRLSAKCRRFREKTSLKNPSKISVQLLSAKTWRKPSISQTSSPRSTLKSAAKIRSNTSASSITPVPCSSETILRSRSAITLRVQTTCYPPAAQRVSSRRFPSMILSKNRALSTIRKRSF